MTSKCEAWVVKCFGALHREHFTPSLYVISGRQDK